MHDQRQPGPSPADEPTSAATPQAVGAKQASPTGRALSAERRAARRIASTCLRTAGSVCTLGRIARALSVSSDTVEHWADPEHDAAVTLGDVLAMPSAGAEAVLVAALAIVQARRLERAAALPPVVRVLQFVSTAAGLCARGAHAASDGTIDDGERRELLELAATVEHAAADARRDLSGAR